MRWDQEPLPIFMDSKIGWFDSPVVHSHFGSYFNIVNILISIGFFLLYDFFFFLRAYYFDMKTPPANLALPFQSPVNMFSCWNYCCCYCYQRISGIVSNRAKISRQWASGLMVKALDP